MKYEVINLTPHTINVADKTFEPSGQIARCEEIWDKEIDVDGIFTALDNFRYGKTNLPEFKNGVWYIVSLPVALAEPERIDLLISVGQIRNDAGQIIGAKGLARI